MLEEKNLTAGSAGSIMARVWRGLEKVIKVLGNVATVCILILMVLTTLDVVLRYIFGSPLKGAYEVSEILFLSAVFLGMAYTQLFREHVNADLFISRLSKHTNLVLETVMLFPALFFFILLTWQGTIAFWDSFISGEYRWGLIRIPLWQARLMVPLGAFFLCLRFIEDIIINLQKILNWEKRGVMNIDPITAAIAMVIVLLILLFLGMPIAFSMMLVGFGGLVMLLGVKGALSSLRIMPFNALLNYLLSVVPMFILMGQFAFHSGISTDLFVVCQKWLSWLPGGLACATVAGCAMFGACSGSSLACCATMGKIAIPEMEKAGYHPRLAAGTVAGAGGLDILIPPSIPMVIYAAASQESVGKLLIAGILPGILSAIIFIGFIILTIKRHPEMAPLRVDYSWKEKLIALKKVGGILFIFSVVMGSIYMGWATPTEAGAVGAFSTLVFALVRRQSSLHDIWGACLDTARQLSMIFTIFIGTTLFGLFISRSGVAMKIAEFLSTLPIPAVGIVIAIVLFYIPLGMFLDTLSMILLTTPIIYPVIIALGFNGIWFGIILIVMCEVGLITPPVAMNLYVVKGVAPHISMEDIIRGALPYVTRDLLIVAILIIFPQIALWLPEMMR